MKEKLIAAAKRWRHGQSWADYAVILEEDDAAFDFAYSYWKDGEGDGTAAAAQWFLLFVAAAAESEGQ